MDHEGEILESFVTKTRAKQAALTFMKKALKRHRSPEAIITDGLASYKAAMKQLGNTEKQHVGRWANNSVENSHLPFRRKERAMLGFRQMKSLQKFASVHAYVYNHLNQSGSSIGLCFALNDYARSTRRYSIDPSFRFLASEVDEAWTSIN